MVGTSSDCLKRENSVCLKWGNPDCLKKENAAFLKGKALFGLQGEDSGCFGERIHERSPTSI